MSADFFVLNDDRKITTGDHLVRLEDDRMFVVCEASNFTAKAPASVKAERPLVKSASKVELVAGREYPTRKQYGVPAMAAVMLAQVNQGHQLADERGNSKFYDASYPTYHGYNSLENVNVGQKCEQLYFCTGCERVCLPYPRSPRLLWPEGPTVDALCSSIEHRREYEAPHVAKGKSVRKAVPSIPTHTYSDLTCPCPTCMEARERLFGKSTGGRRVWTGYAAQTFTQNSRAQEAAANVQPLRAPGTRKGYAQASIPGPRLIVRDKCVLGKHDLDTLCECKEFAAVRAKRLGHNLNDPLQFANDWLWERAKEHRKAEAKDNNRQWGAPEKPRKNNRV